MELSKEKLREMIKEEIQKLNESKIGNFEKFSSDISKFLKKEYNRADTGEINEDPFVWLSNVFSNLIYDITNKISENSTMRKKIIKDLKKEL